ncbi:MAG: cytochrome c biogenesis protein DipZ [Solirubrobacterales bacterium]
MVLLLIFGFIAGAATAISPCALPVLPIVFSAGATGGRKRPLGIATGLAVSFTFATVLLVYLISALELPDGFLRTFAIAVLLVFGLSLIVPSAAAKVEGWISRMTATSANKIQNATTGAATNEDNTPREGFWSGFLIGTGLGFVYAPCAGPILAGVITVSASQNFSSGRLAVALAYGLGSAVTFYALMLGGRKLIAPLVKRSSRFQAAIGVAMVLVAVAMFVNLDTRFQTAIANDLPSFLVNPTGDIEKSSSAKKNLAQLNNRKQAESQGGDEATSGAALPLLGDAPDFTGNQRWFNTPGGQPLSLKQLQGKVVLVDFWTYTCINCIRTLPYVKAWYAKYRDKGLVVVGVHTPEFTFEKSASNVQSAIKQNKLLYPVAQDNNYATWDAFGNQYWPAKYLIDADGEVRYTHFGEGDYGVTERAIRSLLAERGDKDLGAETSDKVKAESVNDPDITPETYLGAARAERTAGSTPELGTKDYGRPGGRLPANTYRLGGRWTLATESATAAGADSRLDFRTKAQKVFLVMGSKGGAPRKLQVLLDGKPIPNKLAGDDVKGGVATISNQRLYRLVDLPSVSTHVLTLKPQSGISGYAFTFG